MAAPGSGPGQPLTPASPPAGGGPAAAATPQTPASPPPSGRWAFLSGVFNNIFEHSIARAAQINAFPRKSEDDGGGIKWPSFYADPISDANGEINYKNLAKKAGVLFGCFLLLSLIGTAIIFTGGAPLVGGLAVLIAGTVLGSFVLPALPFGLSVLFRSIAKTAWTLIAGPVVDLLDNIFHKLPVAVFGPGVKRIARQIKGDQTEEENAPVFAPAGVTSGLTFKAVEKPNGKMVYTPNQDFDAMTAADLKACVRSIATYHSENHGKGTYSIAMNYSSEAMRKQEEAADRNTINNEQADIKKRANPAMFNAGTKGPFTVEENPEGKRIYKPVHKGWTEMDATEKEAFVTNIIEHDEREKAKGDKGLKSKIDLSGDQKITKQDYEDLGKIVLDVKSARAASPATPAVPAATPAVPAAATPAAVPAATPAVPAALVSTPAAVPATPAATPVVARPVVKVVSPAPVVLNNPLPPPTTTSAIATTRITTTPTTAC